MMRFELDTDVAIARDLAKLRLRRGDIVMLVEEHRGPDGSAGYSVEVLNALGGAMRVIAVAEADIEPLR